MDVVYLDIAQVLILVFGGVVVFYASRAYGRTKSTAMLLLSLGFAGVAVGAVAAGVLNNLNPPDLSTPITVHPNSQLGGIIIIVNTLATAKG